MLELTKSLDSLNTVTLTHSVTLICESDKEVSHHEGLQIRDLQSVSGDILHTTEISVPLTVPTRDSVGRHPAPLPITFDPRRYRLYRSAPRI